MSGRNRSEGWKHAKLTGHSNEKPVAELTLSSPEVQNRLLECAHLSGLQITSVQYGGLCEKDVPCILGGMTKSKTDMWMTLSNGKRLNVSVKKEEDGQAFLVGISRFIDGFVKQYGIAISENIIRAIQLYFGAADDINEIIQKFGSSNQKLELRKHRLVATTLRAYNENLYYDLLSWFSKNMPNLFDFCFSRGLAANQNDWADIVWYKNMVGESGVDKMFYLPDLAEKIPCTAEYGTRNGGSTIQLPFGFVQWHSPRKVIPGDLQFHQNLKKICNIAN